MSGLEALLFAVFIVFILVNLLIRSFLRKAKRQKKDGTAFTRNTGDKSDLSFGEPWLSSQDFEEESPGVRSAARTKEDSRVTYETETEPLEIQKLADRAFQRSGTEASGERASSEQASQGSGSTREDLSLQQREIKNGPGLRLESLEKEKWDKERMEKLKSTLEVKIVAEEKSVSFWERMEKLTPLQKAIVLSEVLGPPKGLQ
jgi:hypothetical protein